MTTFVGKKVNQAPHEVWLEARCSDEQCHPETAKEGKGLYQQADFTVFRKTDHSDIEIGRFSFATLPGCCGIVVSFYSSLNEVSRGTAMGPMFHHLKEKVARELGYSQMIATCDVTNFPEVIGASKNRWKILNPFKNRRTGNTIAYMLKNVSEF
jgi:hypothetical protein